MTGFFLHVLSCAEQCGASPQRSIVEPGFFFEPSIHRVRECSLFIAFLNSMARLSPLLRRQSRPAHCPLSMRQEVQYPKIGKA
jgi:hypothetical protein